MRVLYITAEWPSEDYPTAGAFIVRNVKYLRRAGLEIDVYPFRGRRQISRYVNIYRKLHARIRAQHYDLIHAQFGHSGFLVTLPKPLPLVVTFQGSELAGLYTSKGRNEWISPFLRLAMQFVAYRADEVILVSEHMAQYLGRKNYHVIPGGLDLEVFRPMERQEARKALGIPIDEKVVIFVAPSSNG
ncbi:MAG: glycosyltransferase [Anaerolineae bacterium]|nr:glycosyltransferase [Anaerolineae bacterium]